VSSSTVLVDYASISDFYAAPFPSEHRRKADGHIDLTGFPNPSSVALVDEIAKIAAADSDGFGATSGIFFQLSDGLDPTSLPDMRTSLTADSPVLLVSVDESSPDAGMLYPIKADFQEDGGPFGAPNLLTLLPYQGVPLRPGGLYAAVVRRTVRGSDGLPLGPSDVVAKLAAGGAVFGMSSAAAASYKTALDWLSKHGVSPGDIAAIAVFRTGNPTVAFGKVKDDLLSRPVPKPDKSFEPAEVFDGYCVYHTTIKMPTYQAGVPPYDTEGGGWAFDDKGQPVVQNEEDANFVVTLPRTDMPKDGFPVVVFSRTGAGGDRPLVDRGVRAAPGGPAIVPGTGPASEFAKVGWAGSQIDGPHGGLRNVSGKDEQFLVFNFKNPLALRDNIRQSALELVLQAHLLESIEIDASSCPGLATPNNGPAKFDVKTMSAFGHSMGASIVPLAVAFEPRLRGAILSGAGASYIENIVYKEKPVATKGLAELLLGYAGKRELTEFDPVMTILQWAAEPADTQVYARSILREPDPGVDHHIMMVEGVVDHYIMPPIANSTALSLGLDLGGPELTDDSPELKPFDPLSKVLDLDGRSEISLPAAANIKRKDGSTSTAVVVQHPQDNIEDGHEAVFQDEQPKHQYRCFLQSLAKGAPAVPKGATGDVPCE
jgi:hypothetical protein